MGKPGGFFKKLKAKQKRLTSKNRRGTKGASKEDRRVKHNERVAFYAAKRQAEELAEVSSSSEDEPSTDSEQLERQEEKKLRRLRSLLGVSGPHQKRQRSTAEDEEVDELGDDNHDDDSDDAPSAEEEDRPASEDTNSSASPEDDWNYYLGEGGADEEDDDAEDADNSGADSGTDMLFDAGSSEEEEEEEEGSVENPFMALAEEDEDETEEPMLLVESGDDDEEGDVGEEEEEEEEEVEEDDHEDAFVEDEDDDYVDVEDGAAQLAGTPTTKKELRRQLQRQEARERQLAEESQLLLPHFQLGTSSAATIEHSAAVQQDDPWLLKYHLDQHGDVDRSPLQAAALSHTAAEQLAHSNDALREAAAELEGRTTRKERGVFHVSADEYARLHPENVTVAMTAHAQQHLLHAPFECSTAEERPPYVHEALWSRWVAFRAKEGRPLFTAEERGLFDLLQGYPDLMDCTRSWQCASSRREILVLHLLNHWFKARSVVLAHDRIIDAYRQQRKKQREAAAASERREAKGQTGKKAAESATTTTTETEKSGAEAAAAQLLAAEEDIFDSENYELRDRGFGKTRLFVMLPMRNIALQYVKTIVELLGADPLACPKLETFVADFSEMEEAIDPTFVRRPPDYRRQFDGNIDDSFCVGLHLEPSKVHLYAHPLNSDIILCSPLGLRRRIEKSGDVLVSLSAVEVCVMDEAHVLLMQNWDHAAAVFEMLNKRPTDTTHGLSDLRRVYAWALNGKSGRHRQTILCSDISHATLLGALRASLNSSGKVLLQRREVEGAVAKVTGTMRQHFLRFDTTALDRADDERFEYFTKHVFATKLNSLAERDVRIILFVPSYFDFVRLRNYLYREYRDTFAALSEYSTLKQQRCALGQFSDLERPILLVTERFYFFKRYFVKLAEVMVFYSPPLFPEFYSGMLNRLVATSPNAFALTLYCRYDTHELNRLVGTSRTRQLLERESGMFSFVTG